MKRIIADLSLGLLAGQSHAGTTFTYPDLVKRITDLEPLAVLPSDGESCAQWSSYDRKSKFDEATGKYVDWFANGDGKGFIREEDGKQMMAEMNGPGCIWRTWSATPEKGHVRIFLDGSTNAAVDFPFVDYFASGGFVGFPALIYKTAANGFNMHVPIPYQKSCKIVADPGWGNYFQFTYSTFPKGTTVPTFSRKLIAENFAALQEADSLLGEKVGGDPAGKRRGEKTVANTVVLEPGKSASIAQIAGPRAITAFTVKLQTNGLEDAETALRAVTLSMTWDGEAKPSVWTPLGDFFGTAPGINLYKSLPMGMTEGGFYSYWYMPFAKAASIELKNEGSVPVTIECAITHAPVEKSAKTLGRFHAKWHRDALLPEEPERNLDWTMLKTTGRGRFLGVALNVWNPRGDWWGEGDEKFFVDGEKFPSTIGTGSEDYFSYAWSSATLFYQALHNQTRNDGGNRGHLSVNRWHVADNVPFHTSFEGAIEKYFLNARPTLYDCVVYFYQAAGESDPYDAVPVSERIGIYPKPEVTTISGAVEGENLRVLQKTVGDSSQQDMAQYHGKWSDGRQLLWNKDIKAGDRLTLALPVKTAGRFDIAAQFTKAADYGIIQVWLDEQKLGDPIDCFNNGVIASGELKLGACDLTAGEHKFIIECTGKNPASTGHLAGLDYVRLLPAK